MTTNRFLGAIGAGVVFVASAAACGGQAFPNASSTSTSTSAAKSPTSSTIVDSAKSPRARLLASVQRVTNEKTARIALTVAISGSGADETVTGAGVIDIARREMQMSVSQSGDDGSGDDGSSGELRLVDGYMYSHDDADPGWQKLAATSPEVTESITPDPTSYLDYLQGVSDDVKVAGSDFVRGVATTRYSATIDLAHALGNAGTTEQQHSALARDFGVFGGLKIPTSVWIDGLGELRKLQMSIDFGAIATKLGLPVGSHLGVEETLELYDFGLPVDVQAPAGAVDGRIAAQDRAAQSDLRNALTAEKTWFTDNETYSAAVADMKQIEPTLDWGGKLTVGVAAANGDPLQIVCLSEKSASGTTFALADIASGPSAGTYYARNACPAVLDEATIAALDSSW